MKAIIFSRVTVRKGIPFPVGVNSATLSFEVGEQNRSKDAEKLILKTKSKISASNREPWYHALFLFNPK